MELIYEPIQSRLPFLPTSETVSLFLYDPKVVVSIMVVLALISFRFLISCVSTHSRKQKNLKHPLSTHSSTSSTSPPSEEDEEQKRQERERQERERQERERQEREREREKKDELSTVEKEDQGKEDEGSSPSVSSTKKKLLNSVKEEPGQSVEYYIVMMALLFASGNQPSIYYAKNQKFITQAISSEQVEINFQYVKNVIEEELRTNKIKPLNILKSVKLNAYVTNEEEVKSMGQFDQENGHNEQSDQGATFAQPRKRAFTTTADGSFVPSNNNFETTEGYPSRRQEHSIYQIMKPTGPQRRPVKMNIMDVANAINNIFLRAKGTSSTKHVKGALTFRSQSSKHIETSDRYTLHPHHDSRTENDEQPPRSSTPVKQVEQESEETSS